MVITEGFIRLEKALIPIAGKCCVGDAITLADICLVPQIYNAIRFEVDMSKFPTISRIYKYLVEVKAFIDAHPSVQIDVEK